MDAWKARGTSVALAAMGLVATLVGMALVESGETARTRGAPPDPFLAGDVVAAAGEVAVLAGAALMLGAIFVYVLATRRRRSEAAADALR